MTSARVARPLAVVVGLAVPLELVLGGAQPHVENQVLHPGHVRVTVSAAVSGSNVAAGVVSSRYEPIAAGPTPPKVIHAATLDFFSAAARPQPRYDLTSHDRTFLRASEYGSAFHPRSHTIRGRC